MGLLTVGTVRCTSRRYDAGIVDISINYATLGTSFSYHYNIGDPARCELAPESWTGQGSDSDIASGQPLESLLESLIVG